jgi:hypothetical protein
MKCVTNKPKRKCRPLSGCGATEPESNSVKEDESLKKDVVAALATQGIKLGPASLNHFLHHLSRSTRNRKAVSKKLSRMRDQQDIIWLIRKERDAGNLDEAVWRAFLATHFGRTSSQDKDRIYSATKLLCSFGEKPFWTWKRIRRHNDAFRDWLRTERHKLATLKFGNHRKYESPKPNSIYQTVDSFVQLALEFKSPAGLLNVDDDAGDEFDVLYRRFRPIWRFGRTGKFDFLELLYDLKLIKHTANKCYLRGATGPRIGAKQLWGESVSIGMLEQRAIELADMLGVSKFVMEDCLCNWQK